MKIVADAEASNLPKARSAERKFGARGSLEDIHHSIGVRAFQFVIGDRRTGTRSGDD
jgi:hypothetical protein